MKTFRVRAAVLGAALLAAACSNGRDDKGARIAALETQLQQTETALARERAENAGAPAPPSADTATSGNGDSLPPNAEPGHCYARVLVPAIYRTVSERVLIEPEGQRVETTPATYGIETQRVLVQEASERIEVRPAEYRTVTEQILVEPERRELVAVPAVYETRTDRVLARAAYTTWKKGRGPIERLDAATGEIMCLVEVPAEYRTVQRRVEVKPAMMREVVHPAVYRTITKRVVERPAQSRTVTIPPRYETLEVRAVRTPAQQQTVVTPARYADVPKREKVADERLAWREILCETNTTADVVTRLQQALKRKGFDPGPIDGVYGSQTAAAVNAYQRRADMPSGGLTLGTLESLGIPLGGVE